MSVRSALRRRVVLPVTVFHNPDKQLAHTLDATSNSARLAGLQLPLEPGAVIEIQRNASRAKFQVFWVGAPNTLLSGQAGVRSLPGSKTIWTADFPHDEPDLRCETQLLRSGLPLVLTTHTSPVERPAVQQEFKGGASIRATGYSHAIYAQIVEISQIGALLMTPFVLPVSTELYVLLNLQGFVVEVPGVVRASDAKSGMQIGFLKMSQLAQEKLAMALRLLQPPAGVANGPISEFGNGIQLAI
jgi:hypothetical protein